MGLSAGEYAVLTLHRPSNVDDPGVLRGMLDAIARIAERLPGGLPGPSRARGRASNRWAWLRRTNGTCVLSEPLGYLEFCR